MFEIILSMKIKYDNSINWNNFVLGTNHNVKTIKGKLVSMWSPLNFCLFMCYPKIQLTKNVITTLTNQVKSPHQQWYQKPEPFEIHASNPVAHRLTINSTGTHKVIVELVNLTQRFGLLHYGNRIDKCPIFQCSNLTKILICLECDSFLCLKW